MLHRKAASANRVERCRPDRTCVRPIANRRLGIEQLEDRLVLASLVLTDSVFFGGAGEQGGTDIAVGAGGEVYVAGTAEGQGLLVKYPNNLGSPVWSDAGGANRYADIELAAGSIFALGEALPPSCGTSDGVGGTEVKSAMAIYTPSGTRAHCDGDGFFVYTGAERFNGATSFAEGATSFIYAVGTGEVAGFGPKAYVVAKFDATGTRINAATDSSVGISFGSTANPGGNSGARGVSVIGSHVFVAGHSGWNSEDGTERPTIWKYDTNLNLVGRFRDTSLRGQLFRIRNDGTSLYAVGLTGVPNVGNGQDYLIQKYDQNGGLLWTRNFGGAGNDQLWDVVELGGRLYAAGTTTTDSKGGFDIVVYAIDPVQGTVLSSTTFGGAHDDEAFGIATDGTNLVVVGRSSSFASADGNAVGESDLVVLRFAPTMGAIEGTKFNDLDGDGIKDPNEPGLAGWTISLDHNRNGVLDNGEPFTSTDAAGNYSFRDLPAGEYYVRESMLNGWEQTHPAHGVFASPVDYPADRQPHFLAAGDFDNDGDTDVAVANRLGDSVTLLQNNGQGQFVHLGQFTTGAGPESIETRDLNGDGFLDLVVANVWVSTVSIYRGLGTGMFTLSSVLPVGTTPQGIVIDDLNGDQKLDIATANFHGDNVSILMGNGNGTFANAINYSTSSDGPEALATFDYDGDGDLDLAVASGITNDVVILLNNGTGVFSFHSRTAAGSGVNSIVAHDIDGDHDVDLVVANGNTSDLSLLRNTNGLFTETRLAIGSQANGVIAADLDGDGDLDLATAEFNQNRVAVLYNDGSGSFPDILRFAAGGNPHDVVITELNGDGLLDLITPNRLTNNVSVLLQKPGIHGVFLSDGELAANINFGNRFIGNAPRITSPNNAQVVENGQFVIDIQATDADGETEGAGLTYGITGGPDQGLFALDPNSGVLSFAAAPDFELPGDANGDNIYHVEVTVTDSSRATDTIALSVSVLNATAVISGAVFVDADSDGLFDGGTESALDGVTIQILDKFYTLLDSQQTSLGGVFAFEVGDEFGEYRIREIQPTGVNEGSAIVGDANGNGIVGEAADGEVVSPNEMKLTLVGLDAWDFDFTEAGQALQGGDTATIGFWQNRNGQSLIEQGGAALVDWLNSNFRNIFGSTFADGTGGDDSAEVARFYKRQFFQGKLKGTPKVDAQVMATSLAVFFTSRNLSEGVATDYGFRVTDTGIGANLVNVGQSGAAFDVADNTQMSIMALLLATNRLTGVDDDDDDEENFSFVYDLNGDGVLDAYEKSLREMANAVYTWINETGDI